VVVAIAFNSNCSIYLYKIMTKISRYEIDDKVTGSDKWIGSDSQTQYSTKNFTPTKLAVYFNENQIIDIGAPIRYKYDILELGDTRLPGTITFNPQVGTPYPISSITSFLLSKYTLKGNDVSEYLIFLVGSKILFNKADDVNIFGLFKVISVVENLLEPNFFDVTFEYITGNGSIVEDKDYLISLIDTVVGDIPTKTSDLINDGENGVDPFITLEDIPSQPIPTLQDVVDEGNTVSNNNIVFISDDTDSKAYLDNFGLYLPDEVANNYLRITKDKIVRGRLGFTTDIIFEDSDKENIIYVPNKSGIFALTSDIPNIIGTLNTIPKFNAIGLGDSQIVDDGTNVTIGGGYNFMKFSVNGGLFLYLYFFLFANYSL